MCSSKDLFIHTAYEAHMVHSGTSKEEYKMRTASRQVVVRLIHVQKGN